MSDARSADTIRRLEATNVVRTRLDDLDAGRFDQPDEETRSMTNDRLGAHVRRLREVRRLTQDELADRSGLAADTIRRLEHEEFSPSLRTLRKVCDGLGISVAALFNALELSEASEQISRITTLLIGRSATQLQLSERVLTALLDGLDDDPSGRR